MELQMNFKKNRWFVILGLVILMLAASATWVMAQNEGVICLPIPRCQPPNKYYWNFT